MAKKLKTYQTSLGFFEQAIAAPSMKAALEAWGVDSNLFHQGAAKESTDPDVIASTMAKPGIVLKRPVGSDGPFSEHAELPKNSVMAVRPKKSRRRKAKQASVHHDEGANRRAAQAYERERQRREREEREQRGSGRRKKSERRQQAVAKAQAAMDKAEREHLRRAGAIREEALTLEKKSQAEEARWEREKGHLDKAVRRARD